MHKYKLVVLGIVLTISSLLIGVITLKQEAQDKSTTQKDDATPIQLGQITEQQKKHSKLYTHPEENSGKDLLSRGKDVDVIVTAPWGEAYTEVETKPSQETFVQKLACDSDAIVQAKVISKSSQLTEDHRFVFTDYYLVLKEIIKAPSTLKLETSANITLTTPGGVVKVEGRTINVKVKANKRLIVNDTYLLFLTFLADSDSFKAVNNEGIFVMSNGKIDRFNDINSPYQTKVQSKVNFTNLINADTQMCNEKKE